MEGVLWNRLLRLKSSPNIFDELVIPWDLLIVATCSKDTWLGGFPESMSTNLPKILLEAESKNLEAVEQIASSRWI
jgi:hypothetical protein